MKDFLKSFWIKARYKILVISLIISGLFGIIYLIIRAISGSNDSSIGVALRDNLDINIKIKEEELKRKERELKKLEEERILKIEAIKNAKESELTDMLKKNGYK
jgi:hypothetical protein